MITRSYDRSREEMRPVTFEWGIQQHAAASVLVRMGNTHVLCAVSVEEQVPPFLRDSGSGWITAEYGVLPGATNTRYKRETRGQGGRTMEIQRLIGRSLRMMVDLAQIGERTLRVDCDVINADGGTRTASISGGALAVRAALEGLVSAGLLPEMPVILPVAAVSVGVVDGDVLLDLDYSEDSSAQTDANFVAAAGDRWIEIQATAEERPYSEEVFLEMARLARKGINELLVMGGWT